MEQIQNLTQKEKEYLQVNDIQEPRYQLPVLRKNIIRPGMILGCLKECIGKDINSMTMPVFIQEPLTLLQKSAEVMCFDDELFTKASKETDSCRRMAYIAAYQAGSYSLVKGRTLKPMNSFLGETYELVTPKIKFFSEQVSTEPRVNMVLCQGEGWSLTKHVESSVTVTSRGVKMHDEQPTVVELRPECQQTQETYRITHPDIILSGVIMGTRKVDPSGTVEIVNQSTGDICQMEFTGKGSGIFSKSTKPDQISGIIRSQGGQKRLKVFGAYSSKIQATDLLTKETFTIFEAPQLPTNSDLMYNMNFFALQLHHSSEQLSAKIPSTDSRWRKDISLWEKGDLQNATKENQRLEKNDRLRFGKVTSDEYKPQYFNKEITQINGKKLVTYSAKTTDTYWTARENGFTQAPRIFDDECSAFGFE